ncbi:oxygen-independent coproporphyrinogen III oxidase [Algoriphagus boritolerans]|uniref:Coproporphyrinogen-III oxidase n=1 Tax=Algoriphagus boritolerans DSM 17298 = JCM 18970 TaxID=1120964 RepID=A0A1H5ZTJ3_9BACT|nr:oxygen-independent coproporphyrinogen III oxidase [Algoriphagus boritolerans]SEG39853.1 oxygen-independent coproporphyrinogen-3 oxidase [Algoriphagus boritolerans DSM 17298 = JCM 18970]
MTLSPKLIQKYNQPVPRYTSYPTVPFWEGNLNSRKWELLVRKAFQLIGEEKGLTLYIHLPFCENLCTYCGCTKRITKNHGVEDPYLEAIFREWSHYLGLFKGSPKIAGIHLGGGTPTFFSPQNLKFLISKILKSAEILPDHEFSFEGHPNNTTFEHLQKLAKLGFDRVSYGIQDFDLTVQKAIHRIQPFEKVKEATENARKLGYTSVNFDLIYGLPHQTIATLKETFDRVSELKPDRIAFYSYAHLPSAFPAQKSFESYLPNEQEKRALYEVGKEMLLAMGYEEVGMDHFALPDDPLCSAKRSGNLHRNFMGYTTSPSEMLIGLGASSISDIGLGFSQNEKKIEVYEQILKENRLPVTKGHTQTEEDQLIRKVILDLICRGKAEIPFIIWEKLPLENLNVLFEMEKEGLIFRDQRRIEVTTDGMAVVRNICALFDMRMVASKSQKVTFSKSI